MKLSYLFKPLKYINKIKSINNSFKKSQSVRELINNDILSTPLSNVWRLEKDSVFIKETSNISEYKIFGTSINLNNINWHKDYVSGFEYPVKRFDKIKISKWFDKGIDVKFPWEVSRFYFAIRLAQNYVITKDEKYYKQFKNLVLDWIEKNTFCYGVNWVCTMEIAIRSINWIVAVNIFGKVFEEDNEFKEVISKSLIQHAEYISAFPEIYDNGHTTNHTTADYTGLLFLALTLKEHPKSKKWLEQATKGLEECIKYQTYDDGVNFEASIPYHRLVLEMFAYSAIVCRANEIDLSKKYYELLFKMFEYSAAYMDHNGNAPQVGDNDSGRILIFHQSDEHDHSYLLDLGEHIFDYKFKSQCQKRNPEIKKWLPKIEKVNINKLDVKPRETDRSIAFEKGGAYFLKNENFSLLINCFPLGQNGNGGHNHLDVGSITLSYRGIPILIDPGSFNYTKNYNERNQFRNFYSHNIPLPLLEKVENYFIKNNIWGLKSKVNVEINDFNAKSINYKLKYFNNIEIERNIELFENSVIIKEKSNSDYKTFFLFHPEVNERNNTFSTDKYKIKIISNCNTQNSKLFYYSKSYGVKTDSIKIIFQNLKKLEIKYE